MARAKKKRKITPHMRAFGKVAKAANIVCHAETSTVTAYKKCMSTNMKAGLKKAGVTKKRKAAPKKAAAKKCKGTYATGPKKGKLKSGYTYRGVKKGRCPRKAG